MSRDDAYLLDILVAARRVREYCAGLDWGTFERSTLHQDAIVRRLSVIGEAARKISQATRNAHPNVPWTQIVGMRHRLIHDYSHVNLRTVWDVAQNDIPPLIAAIEPLVPPDDEA